MRIISNLFLVCFLCSSLGFGKEYKNPLGVKVDEYLSSMVPFGFDGAVLISKHENILINNGYGFADPKHKMLNTSATVFSLGSIVKPFIATLTMKLVQEGKLSLDDTFADFFIDVPEDKAGISIRQLLSHSSGLPGAIGMDTDYISKKDYILKVMNSELSFTPGDNYSYSNVGFTLLAMIIERITGMTYEQYLKTTILDPAEMNNTGYSVDWKRTNLAHNISDGEDNGTFLDRQYFPTWHLIGNGGLLSTTNDMFKFYLFMKNGNLLSEESKRRCGHLFLWKMLMVGSMLMEERYFGTMEGAWMVMAQ